MNLSWRDRVAAAAQALNIPVGEFDAFLQKIGVDMSTAKRELFDDFRKEFEKHMSQFQVTSFNLRKSWDILCGFSVSDGIQVSTRASPLDLIEIIANQNAPRERRRQAYEALCDRPISSNSTFTWGEAAFVVLKPQPGNHIDVDATREVMQVLLQGSSYIAPKSRVFKLTQTTRYVVYRLDEVFIDSLNPKVLRVRDPLNPKDVLDVAGTRMVSKKYNVLIDLPDDRIQLLLFAIEQELRAPPRDTQEAEALVALVRSANTIEDAAKALGDDVFVRWAAAAYVDPSSPMALPQIRVGGGSICPNNTTAGTQDLEKILNQPLDKFDRNLLYQVIVSARAEQIKEAIEALGQSPRGTVKAELARQLIAFNPPLKHIVTYILLGAEEPLEKLLNQPYEEWLLSAIQAAVASKLLQPQ